MKTPIQLLETEAKRIAFIGIGNEMNGDDAAGIIAVRRLKAKFSGQENILTIEGGIAPENATGIIRRFSPDLILFIDAAQMNESPGTIKLIHLDQLDGISATTHSLPLSVLARFLMSDIDCQIKLIGIQPEQIDFEAGLSPEIEKAISQITDDLSNQFKI